MLRGKGLLTPLQRAFLAAFATLPDQGSFYLAGAPALAEFGSVPGSGPGAPRPRIGPRSPKGRFAAHGLSHGPHRGPSRRTDRATVPTRALRPARTAHAWIWETAPLIQSFQRGASRCTNGSRRGERIRAFAAYPWLARRQNGSAPRVSRPSCFVRSASLRDFVVQTSCAPRRFATSWSKRPAPRAIQPPSWSKRPAPRAIQPPSWSRRRALRVAARPTVSTPGSPPRGRSPAPPCRAAAAPGRAC